MVELRQFHTGGFDFLIVALAVFLVIKAINAAKKKEEAAPATPPAPPAPTKEETLLTEIRDLLKSKKEPITKETVS